MITSHSPVSHACTKIFPCSAAAAASAGRARALRLRCLCRFWQLLSPALGRSVAARSDLGRSQRGGGGGGGRDGAGEQYTRWWNWWNGGETFPRRRRFLQTYFGNKMNRGNQRLQSRFHVETPSNDSKRHFSMEEMDGFMDQL